MTMLLNPNKKWMEHKKFHYQNKFGNGNNALGPDRSSSNRVVALVGRGGVSHPLRTIPLVEQGGKKKTKEEEEGMGGGGSGAEFRPISVVVVASPNGSADAVAAEEEEKAAILLAKAKDAGMGRAPGSIVHFGGGLMGFFSWRGFSPLLI